MPAHDIPLYMDPRDWNIIENLTTCRFAASVLQITAARNKTEQFIYIKEKRKKERNKLCSFSPQANYIDRAAAVCRRS
jgi:hypothetical protein